MTLECRISNPKAEVKWIKDGVQLFEYDRVTIAKEGQRRAITIRGVGERDSGSYMCECGREVTSCWLSVTGTEKKSLKYLNISLSSILLSLSPDHFEFCFIQRCCQYSFIIVLKENV